MCIATCTLLLSLLNLSKYLKSANVNAAAAIIIMPMISISPYQYTAGVQLLTLTSTPISEGDHLIACPGTSITITCSATQVNLLAWFSMPGSLVHNFVPNDYNTDDARVVKGSYTLTLVEATNVSGSKGNLISDLMTLVNGITNGMVVTCQTLSTQKSVTIYKKGELL